MTDALTWLRANGPGFNELRPEELEAIADFSLLTSLFEARLLGSRGSERAICNLVDLWKSSGQLDEVLLATELSYFRRRYFRDASPTDYLDGLRLPDNELGQLVISVIAGQTDDVRNRYVSVLIIVFRYRHNLFHGEKWKYRLTGQLDNFRTANSVLMKLLDRHGALAGE